MTSKERVKRAIEFKKPDKLPMEFGVFGVSDTLYFSWNQIGTGDNSKRETLDEWGCTWSRSEVKNMGLVTGNPLDDWEKLSAFKFPAPDDPKFYEGMKERSLKLDRDKYIKAGIFMVLFERLQSLRGFENLMLDFYIEREKIEALADRIVDFDVTIIKNMSRMFPGLVDGISFTDDWGTEQAAFISVELFNEFFKPRYEKIFGACHEAGWHVWLHSCGKVTSLIPSLIEAGVDVFNLLQPRVLGIESFGKKFAGKTCFSTCADIQHTLPFKTNEEIAEEVDLLLKYWATSEGGFVVSDYGDAEAVGVRIDAEKAMFDAYIKYDPFAVRG
ncbi:hypothetical protein FACS1894141_0270 [Spirochaetia bacterium]|nr:hypothetical protein FACS1894141_0270 [Spirochaetia bacterium]